MSELSLRSGALIAGRYRLERLLGEGGMAIVWAATHVITQRAVAMKFLREALRGKEELRVRFHREASASSALRHPNVVEILDVFDFEEGAPVMVMELLEGETLGQKLERDRKLSLEETAALILPVISAVGAAHAFGIVHRDLKPDNVFLVSTPASTRVKVLDFGIAKVMSGVNSRAMRTEAGSMLGTPCYMAPEQASGHAVDHRADIWSLGVILYECLSGKRPIEGDDLLQVVTRLQTATIVPLERLAPELPHDVHAAVMQMLSRDPARRPADLTAASRLLGGYTRATAPPFGPVSAGDDEEPAQGRVVQGHSADPRGPTMISSPPVPSSVTVIADATGARPARSGRPMLWLVAGVLLVGVGVIVLLRSSGSPDAVPSVAAPLDEPSSAAPAATATIAAVPAESAPLPVAAKSAEPPAPTASEGKRVTPRPRPAPRPAEAVTQRPRSAEDAAPPKPSKDEDTLFSGRK